jgi:AcrR family transcriptional regulator
MPKLRDPKKENAIKAAALKLVLQTGFNALKMAEIAKMANMAVGTLYIYFESKEKLINSLFVEIHAEIATILNRNDSKSRSAKEQMKKKWTNLFMFFLENPDKLQFVLLFAHSGAIEEMEKQRIEHRYSPFFYYLTELQQKVKLKNIHTHILLNYLLGSGLHLIHSIKEDSLKNYEKESEMYFEMIWGGIKA